MSHESCLSPKNCTGILTPKTGVLSYTPDSHLGLLYEESVASTIGRCDLLVSPRLKTGPLLWYRLKLGQPEPAYSRNPGVIQGQEVGLVTPLLVDNSWGRHCSRLPKQTQFNLFKVQRSKQCS